MAYLSVIRPLNCAIAFFSVALGYCSAAGPGAQVGAGVVVLAGMSAFFIAAFGNVVNDVLDIQADALNNPHRPLPSGRISREAAALYSIVLLFAGFAFARAISTRYLFMAFGVAALLWLYSMKLKRGAVYGNLSVAGLTGFTLVYGGLLTPAWVLSLVPAALAFVINLAREFIKTAMDREGDGRAGFRTLAVVRGAPACYRAAGVLLAFLAALLPLPYLIGIYQGRYLAVVSLGVGAPALYMAALLLRGGLSDKAAGRISLLLKVMMVIGICAILLGRGRAACAPVFSV